MKRLLLFAVCCACLSAQSGLPLLGAGGPSGNGYATGALFTFNVYPASNLTAFPNLILGTYSQLADVAHGGYVQNTVTLNGQTVPADLIFTSDSAGTTLLSWEIEAWNNTTGAIVAWVKDDRSSSADTLIYVWVGKASVTTYQCTASATWDSNYAAVWHFPNGTTVSFNDSTSNANNGTAVGSPTPIAGAVDGGVTEWRGPGYNNDATVPISSSINIASKLISLEFWFRRNDTSSYSGGDGDFFATEENSGNNGYQFLVNHPTSNSFTLYNWGVATENFGAMPLDTAWHHVALVSDNSAITAYVDGSPTSPTATSTSGVATSNTVLNLLGYGAYKPNGWSVDELRLSNTNRSADWVAHEYTQQSQASAWYTVGSWTL